MADENKPAFYPRVGNIKAKNFKPAQPPAFVEDPRAMDLPQYGDVDLSVPSKENLEMARRMAERDAQLRRQQEADRSPLEKLAGGIQAGRFLGSAMTQGINSIPTRLVHGDEAADKFMQDRIYKPEQPVAYEYAQDVGDFLDKLETEYKLPPLMPEALPLQFLTGPATAQAARAAGKGAVKAGMALERSMEPVVRGALERGGLPREMVMAMGANTQSNVMKTKGGNFMGGERIMTPERYIERLMTPHLAGETPAQRIPHHENALLDPTISEEGKNIIQRHLQITKGEAALDQWAKSNLLNYYKNDLATPNDPVRQFIDKNYADIEAKYAKDQERAARMSERAALEPDPRRKANLTRQAQTMRNDAQSDYQLAMDNVTHLPKEDLLDVDLNEPYMLAQRKQEGFPEQGMGVSEPARRYETLADGSLKISRAGDIQDTADINQQLNQATNELRVVEDKIGNAWIDFLRGKGLDEQTVITLNKMPTYEKAQNLGMSDELQIAQNKQGQFFQINNSYESNAFRDNPFVSKLDPETKLFSGSMYGLGFDHVMDVLREDVAARRIRPEQLNKLTVEQAVRRTQEYNLERAKTMRDAKLIEQEGFTTYKDYPDQGYKWIELAVPEPLLPENYKILPDVTNYKNPGNELYSIFDGNGNVLSTGATEAEAKKLFKRKEREQQLADALKYEGDTMGHCVGGYCPDVIKGRSKIYSLRDAKGEPHVTIEVEPQNEKGYYNSLDPDARRDLMSKALEYRRQSIPDYDNAIDSVDRAEILRNYLQAQNIEIPARIKQIKGKQNAKPKDDYLPFVQDFVKGGNWSDIGDFKNTGLIREGGQIMTPAEHADWLLKELGADTYNELGLGAKPPAGMKRGGKVSISNNPDTMMLAVNNQKMKNGVPAYGAGKAVTKMGLKAAKNEVPRLAMQFGNNLPLNMADDLIKRSPSVDRINMNYKDVTKRVPELTEAAQKLQAGELDRETYAKLVQALKPVKPYDFVPKPATADEARGALKEDARDTYGIPSQTLEAGHPVGLRLDIPAYTNKGVWVPTVHEQDAGFGAGKKIGHESVASVLNPEFGMSEKAALSIASGKPKGTIATIKGDWNPTSEADIIAKAKEYLKHPEWRQVGMDPERHSFFYDRETMAPVVNAEEVIQIGPLVLAKNPKFGKPEDFKYSGGGLTGGIKQGLKAARPVVSDADRALPLRLTRAMPKSADEINAHAERVARQMIGEHVTSGKAGDTKNLAGRSMKESQRVKALEYELEPTKVVPESQVYQPRIGDINVALGGDFTVSDVMLKKLMGEEVNSKQEGGSRYGLGHMKAKTPLFYASNEVPAQAVQNKVTDLYDLFGPERVMGHHMAMGPIATNFAQHFADANLRYTDYSKLTPENMLMFDQLMAKGYEVTKKNPKTGEVITKVVDFPRWPGIANPEAAYKAMRENSEMRKFYNKVMQTPSITEPLGLPNGLDVRYAITSPDLRDMEVNLTGHGVGELVPYGQLTDTARHKTYSKGIPGMYEGHQEVLTPFAISFPDAAQHIISTQRPQDFTGTIQKVFPHQRVDQQFIDEMEQYRKRIKELTGQKKGGAISKPNAKIDGNEFVLAAQKYGIKDSMNNLNKIVDLVNKGLSVDDAARQVADTGMHKAAGGAIRGDDLILEERPL